MLRCSASQIRTDLDLQTTIKLVGCKGCGKGSVLEMLSEHNESEYVNPKLNSKTLNLIPNPTP